MMIIVLQPSAEIIIFILLAIRNFLESTSKAKKYLIKCLITQALRFSWIPYISIKYFETCAVVTESVTYFECSY